MIWEERSFDFKGEQVEFGKGVPEQAKGIIVLVHGFAEHMGRYYDFIEFIQQKGYGVYAINHLGHGNSGARRGHVESFFDLVDSVNDLVDLAKAEHKGTPLFMLGHSMGGLVSIAYGIKYPNNISGQIFSAPAIKVDVPKIQEVFLKCARLLIPKKQMENKVANAISKDQDVVEKYLNDELVLKSATINFYYQVFLKGTEYINNRFRDYHYPFLILHGTQDKIINYNNSQRFFDKCASQEKSIKIYQGLYHELLNEPEKEMVKEDIYNWLENKISK